MVSRMWLTWFFLVGYSVVVGLSAHQYIPRSAGTPARLPSYEELAPKGSERVCGEHSESLILKTIQRGINKGRQYWCCGNSLPCDHFEWFTSVEEEGTAGIRRLAGDEAQRDREDRNDVSVNRADDESMINGTISKFLYQSSGGFTVVRLRCEDGSTVGVKANGCLATARVGDDVRLYGKWTRHARYGRQFEARQAEEIQKVASYIGQGFALWLGSGVVSGVGPATSQKLLIALGGDRAEEMLARFGDARKFGAEDKEAIDFLSKNLGWNQNASVVVPQRTIFAIADKVVESATARRVIVSLVDDFNLPIEAACALYKAHDSRAPALYNADPHGALLAAPGWGFPRADTLILSLYPASIWSNSSLRLSHGLTHILSAASGQGHCAQSVTTLIDRARRDLSTAHYIPETDALSTALHHSIYTGQISALDPKTGIQVFQFNQNTTDLLLLPPWLDAAERRIALAVAQRALASSFGNTTFDKTIAADTALSKKQRFFVTEALSNGVIVLAGGPGTGKTRSARELVRTLYRIQPTARVALCAPTARGAAALGVAVGERASTLHRLLEWREGEFGRDEQRPLELDLVIVDEVSMLEVPLCAKLLAALPPSARLVLIGDPDQLPAVGPGALLRDLLLCPAVPRVTLKHIFRQKNSGHNATLALPGTEAADVARTARAVNANRLPDRYRNCLEIEIDGSRHLPDGVVFLDTGADANAARLAIVETLRRLSNHNLDPLADVQVLAPMKRGDCGVDAINAELQHFVHHEQKGTSSKKNEPLPPSSLSSSSNSKAHPLLGDRVIQLVNDYDTGVFNGDVGLVDTVNRNGSFVARFHVGGPKNYARVMYAPADMGTSVSLAYCLTVHKAQGNEYPVVVIPLVHEASYMLTRPLLYTAISRAKRLLIFIGSPELLNSAVRRASTVGSTPRLTGLLPRLHASLDQRQNKKPPLSLTPQEESNDKHDKVTPLRLTSSITQHSTANTKKLPTPSSIIGGALT